MRMEIRALTLSVRKIASLCNGRIFGIRVRRLTTALLGGGDYL